MTVWDWINNYRSLALRCGDAERIRLTEFHPRAYALREVDPDNALAIYTQGRQFAQLLEEPLWALFFDHWRVTMLLWFKQDYTDLLELAVRNVLEVRKPLYDPLNLRVTMQRTLLCVYQALDLHGYADEIRAGLDELEKLISREGEEKYLIQSNRIGFHYTVGEYDRAHEACLQTLRWADEDGTQYEATHHSVYAYALLCGACWFLKDWEGLENWAALGAEVTEWSGHRMEAIEFLVWHAVLARRASDEAKARRLRQQALGRLRHLKSPTSDLCYEGLCAYHSLAAEWDRVVKQRRRELARCEKVGSVDEVVRCRIKICQALVEQGKPIAEEVEVARRLASVLRRPQIYLDELETIARTAKRGHHS